MGKHQSYNQALILATSLLLVVSAICTKAEAKQRLRPRRQTTGQTEQNEVIGTRIVGGQLAPVDKFPYFASWGDGSCGASLVWKDVLLSAAHCASISSNKVVIGSTNILFATDGETRSIITRRIHPDYDDGTVANDFVILKLDTPSTKIPVPLPSLQTPNRTIKMMSDPRSLPQDGTELTVMGFGTTSEGNTMGSYRLREVNVTAVPHELCASQYSPSPILEDVMFCAGAPNGGKDSCQGDSGGPIVDAKMGVQVGVVSWGQGCGRVDYPGVYARVGGVVDWIKTQICELSSDPPDDCNKEDTEEGFSTVIVRISIQLDDYPTETSFQITDSNSNIVASKRAGSFRTPGSLVMENLDLRPGDYELLVEDQHGDGLCCSYGQGNFSVQALVEELWQPLVTGDGSFTNFATARFNVPELEASLDQPTSTPTVPSPHTNVPSPLETPTNAPSQAVEFPSVAPSQQETISTSSSPTMNETRTDSSGCRDQEGVLFEVDMSVGSRDCIWLAVNADRFGFLCQFLDVAATCPDTCTACEYFL